MYSALNLKIQFLSFLSLRHDRNTAEAQKRHDRNTAEAQNEDANLL
jgi:hypothetical protein